MTQQTKHDSASAFRQVVDGYLRLHALTVASLDDSDEADRVRDNLDGPWQKLCEKDREIIQGLSVDLFAISASPYEPKELNPQAQKNLTIAKEAKDSGDWQRSLQLLRRWSQYVAPDRLASLRGNLWLRAGYPEAAHVFYTHAATLNPTNYHYPSLALHTLAEANLQEGISSSLAIVSEPMAHPPAVVIQACGIALKATTQLDEEETQSLLRQLINAVSLVLPYAAGDKDKLVSITGTTYLGLIHHRMHEPEVALRYYNLGLQEAPRNDALLTGRGILLYGENSQSIADFELAIEGGSDYVWPYFYLAHHYLMDNRFRDVVRMGEKALHRNASPAMRSELYNWLGIAKAELNAPAEEVRKAFSAAIGIDGENECARANLAKFEAMLTREAAEPHAWNRWSDELLRAAGAAFFRDAGLAQKLLAA